MQIRVVATVLTFLTQQDKFKNIPENWKSLSSHQQL